jgi:hypothetical protein
MSSGIYYMSSGVHCMSTHNVMQTINTITKIPQITLSDKTIMFLIIHNHYDSITNLHNMQYKFNHDVVLKATQHHMSESRTIVFLFEHVYVDVTEKMLFRVIKHGWRKTIRITLENFLKNKDDVSDDVILILHDIYEDEDMCKIEGLQEIISKHKFELNDDTFVKACSYIYPPLILQLLDSKHMPTTTHFNIVLSKKYERWSVYHQHENKRIDLNKQHKNTIINMFIEYGYNLSYHEFLWTISYRLTIKNINRFDFDYDDRFIEACTHANFYPYPDKQSNQLKTLIYECGANSSICVMKSLIKDGLCPNIDCLITVCGTNNYEKLKIILSEGVIPNLECLRLCAEIGNIEMIRIVTEQYINTHDEHAFKKLTNPIEYNMKKKHKLSLTMIAFYKKNLLKMFETHKTFSKIKQNINHYIKTNNLLTKHELSFKVDKGLSCFGLTENTIVQKFDMDNFISYILTYEIKS